MPLPESSIAPISCWAEIAGGAAGLSAGARGLGAASVVMLCRLTYRRPDELACRTQEDDSSVTAYDAHRARLRWPELDSWPATARSRRSARTFRGRAEAEAQAGAHASQEQAMNNTTDKNDKGIDRRDFFRAAGAGLTAAGRGAESGRTGARAVQDRQGSARPHRVVHLADSFDFQEPPRCGGGGRGGAGWQRRRAPERQPRRRALAPRAGGATAAPARRAATGRGTGSRAGRAAVADQRRLVDRSR